MNECLIGKACVMMDLDELMVAVANVCFAKRVRTHQTNGLK
jgi:hypothetical protein